VDNLFWAAGVNILSNIYEKLSDAKAYGKKVQKGMLAVTLWQGLLKANSRPLYFTFINIKIKRSLRVK
jgi:hypothetical protein